MLWILAIIPGLFGLISSLIGTGSNFAFQNLTTGGMRSMDQMLALYTRLIAEFAPIFMLQTLAGLVAGLIGMITRAGTIAAVQHEEDGSSLSFGQAFGAGLKVFWKFLGMTIILGLPLLVLGLVLFVVVGVPLLPLIQAFASGANPSDDEVRAIVNGIVAGACVAISLGCVGLIYLLIAAAIQTFGERAIVVEGTGVTDGIRRGWRIFRANLGNVILLAVVLFIISVVISFGLGVIGNAVTLPAMGAIMRDMAEGFQPASSPTSFTLLSSPLLVLFTVISAVVGIALQLFVTVLWTLAYRQFTGAGTVILATPRSQPPLPSV
jgi:hypothetical protein